MENKYSRSKSTASGSSEVMKPMKNEAAGEVYEIEIPENMSLTLSFAEKGRILVKVVIRILPGVGQVAING